jgi:hypothetical protein
MSVLGRRGTDDGPDRLPAEGGWHRAGAEQPGSPPVTYIPTKLFMRDLGWTEQEAADTYHRLHPFGIEWDGPAMDAHDEHCAGRHRLGPRSTFCLTSFRLMTFPVIRG